MSLINQALRKAERDRSPNRMAEPGSSASAPVAAAAGGNSGMKIGLVIGLVVAVAVLIGLVAGLSIVLVKGRAPASVAQQASEVSAPTTPATTTAALPEAAPETPAAPSQIEPIPAAPELATANTLPLEREKTPSVVEELRLAREAIEAKAAAEAKAAEEAAARAAVKPSQDIIDWLSRSKISGVKISETDSKVILNGESYSVGEYANFTLGLKVMIIQEKRVLFVDNNGKKYMKRL